MACGRIGMISLVVIVCLVTFGAFGQGVVNRIVNVGDDVLLTCNAQVNRTWYHNGQPVEGTVSDAGTLSVEITNVTNTGRYECRSSTGVLIYWLLFQEQYFLIPSEDSYICAQLGQVVEVSMQFRTETQVKVQTCEAFINVSNGGNTRKRLTLDSQGKGHVNINFTKEPTTVQFECPVSIPPYTRVQSSVIIIQDIANCSNECSGSLPNRNCGNGNNGTDQTDGNPDLPAIIGGSIAAAIVVLLFIITGVVIVAIICFVKKRREQNGNPMSIRMQDCYRRASAGDRDDNPSAGDRDDNPSAGDRDGNPPVSGRRIAVVPPQVAEHPQEPELQYSIPEENLNSHDSVLCP